MSWLGGGVNNVAPDATHFVSMVCFYPNTPSCTGFLFDPAQSYYFGHVMNWDYAISQCTVNNPSAQCPVVFRIPKTTSGSILGGTSIVKFYGTLTNCSSNASPAVCAAAPEGAVAMPTGTNPTLTINTTAVTALSNIRLTVDDSLTVPSTTCNSTLATLVGGIVVTGRVAGTSFTVSYNGTIAVNPLCFSYQISN